MILKCHCGKETEYANPQVGSYNVGAVRKATDWVWLPTYDGGTKWLCESCGVRAKELAKELFGILGTCDVPFSFLLKGTEKADNGNPTHQAG